MSPRIIKIGRNILFMLSVPVIISAFVFADVATKNEICKGVQITFANNQLSFVTRENIQTLLNKKGIIANKSRVRNIKINELEQLLEENKWINNADIFVSASNIVHIKITQKTPVVRIQPDNDYEEPYYLDEYGNTIAYSEQYIPDLPVVTAPEIGFNSRDLALKSDIVTLAKYISKDTFWSAAISQVVINADKSIQLVPSFGNQQIILGDVSQLDNKMCKLLQFYKQGYHTVNWDKYDEIDLRFERQVVCRNTRGERLSVDPYDKTTHKDIQTLPAPADVKPSGTATTTVTTPVANHAPVVVASKVVAPSPKATTPAKASPAPLVKPAVKKEQVLAKNQTKEPVKAKTETKEIKPKVTEIEHSKYFK